MDYEIQYGRIATTERLSDRFLNCQVKTSQNLTKAFMGKVYTLVEILSPWLPNVQVGQSIVSSFAEAYFDGGSTSDLANFEEALKKVNENLAQITQNGETSWIGNLNGILAVVVENKLHLAQTGQAEAYIFRDGKINHITYGLAQNQIEPHPLKTFSNVTSGEIKPHDKVLITNPSLFRELDIETLRQLISMSSAREAAMQIAKLLKRKKAKAVNLIILELLPLEEISSRVSEDAPETIYLDKPLDSALTVAANLWRQIVLPILKFVGKNAGKAGQKSLVFTKSYLATLDAKRKESKPVIKKDLFSKEFLSEERDEGLLKDEKIEYSPELQNLKVNDYTSSRSLKPSSSSSKKDFSKIFSIVLDYITRAIHFTVEMFRNPRKRPYLLVLGAIIVFTFIGFLIFGNKNSSNKTNLLEAQNTLRDAETINKEALSALSAKDNEKAKNLFAQVVEKTKSIRDYPVVSQTASEIYNQASTELDKLTATTRFTKIDPVLNFEVTAKSVFVIGSKAYLVSANEIHKTILGITKTEKVASIPKNAGEAQFGTALEKSILIYTSAQKIFEFDLATEDLEEITTEGSWETANAMAAYNGNLYLLDGIVGQIYKHSESGDNYAKGESYVASSVIDLKKTVSMTIDGSVYVLADNGEALKISKGKLQNFSLTNIPSPETKLDRPVKIYTDSDTASIYILDAGQKRIVEFDKEGRFVHQYALPENFEDIRDMSVNYKSKKIWVLNNKSLYELAI